MLNKLAKLKYLANNFEIIEEGDHVVCAISQKKIPIENLSYWNVEEQEAYYSFVEASIKRDLLNKDRLFLPPIMRPDPLIYVF